MRRYLALFLALVFFPCIALADLTVYFLDVGQADCAYIDCDGKGMLIDAGENPQYIHSFLNSHSVERIEYIIATHPHKDHIGGLAAVLQQCKVYQVFSPVLSDDSKEFKDALKYAREKNIDIIRPYVLDFLRLGNATVTFLSDGSDSNSDNDMSLVVRIDYGQTSFLFMGDAEKRAEKRLLQSAGELASDVIKIGHHGSNTASSDDFLRAVNPDYAVISCGKGYSHPHQVTLDSLKNMGIEIYRTDIQGTITCRSDGYNITFDTGKTVQNSNELFKAPEK